MFEKILQQMVGISKEDLVRSVNMSSQKTFGSVKCLYRSGTTTFAASTVIDSVTNSAKIFL